MIIKFHNFKDIADHLQTFLKVLQTDAPMVPLMSDTLETLVRRYLKVFIKNDDASTPYQLIKIDVNDKDNQLPLYKVSNFFKMTGTGFKLTTTLFINEHSTITP